MALHLAASGFYTIVGLMGLSHSMSFLVNLLTIDKAMYNCSFKKTLWFFESIMLIFFIRQSSFFSRFVELGRNAG